LCVYLGLCLVFVFYLVGLSSGLSVCIVYQFSLLSCLVFFSETVFSTQIRCVCVWSGGWVGSVLLVNILSCLVASYLIFGTVFLSSVLSCLV
jgi:hypothetical protein